MSNFLSNSIFFGVLLCLLSYQAGVFLRQKTKIAAFNPLLISIIIVIFVLVMFNIKFEDFYKGSKYIDSCDCGSGHTAILKACSVKVKL